MLELLCSGDAAGAEAILDRSQERLSPLEMIEEIFEPTLVEMGERSFRQESHIFEANVAGYCLIGRLHRLNDHARRSNIAPRRRVLVGTVEGDEHEGEYPMVSMALELAGWRAIGMGVNLPVHQLELAIDAWKPNAVTISFAWSQNITKRFAELARIRLTPVFVGGLSIVHHQGLARRWASFPWTVPSQPP